MAVVSTTTVYRGLKAFSNARDHQRSLILGLVCGCVSPVPLFSEWPDYHWFRRNNDGSWSHKPGSSKARDTDDNGDAISNPEDLTSTPGATEYDKFCTWVKYTEADVGVRGAASFDLVDVAPNTVQITATGTSGIPYGWRLTDPEEIDGFVDSYLTGLTQMSDPNWDTTGYHGFLAEAEAGVLSPTSGLWTDTDEVMITVWLGVIEVATYPGTGEEVFVDWYEDSQNLEDYLVSESETRLECLLESRVPIPTASEWGIAVMAVLILTAGTLIFMRPRAGATGATVR
jgi:hypothetical protein